MTKPDPFVGIQISPISFIDEGVDAVLETLQDRLGINVLMMGTISWLGLKVGRRISHGLEGWAGSWGGGSLFDAGGAYFKPRSRYYTQHAYQGVRL